MKILQALLSALLPLISRRVLAAERQAQAAERQEELLRMYFCWTDPVFRDLLQGVIPEAEAAADVQADHGAERDLKTARLEQLQQFWHERHGEWLDDERLVAEYERLYEDASERLDAEYSAEGVRH